MRPEDPHLKSQMNCNEHLAFSTAFTMQGDVSILITISPSYNMLAILETDDCGLVVMDTVHNEKQTNNNSNYKNG